MVAGCALVNTAPAQAQVASMTQPSTPVGLVPYQDTWADARPRWWDIASYHDTADHYNQYNGWGLSYDSTSGTVSSSVFQYQGGQLTLTYDQKPNKPYFIGHVDATGLKPNFAYQLKLVGKPLYGPRGCGPYTVKNSSGQIVSQVDGGGEDWANDSLGHIGRWWNDSNASGNTNAITDSVYASTYPTDTIYGYIFMGDFITDAAGNASVDFTGNNNYHITFQNWQSGKQVRLYQQGSPSTQVDALGYPYFPIVGSGPDLANNYYAYGTQAPSTFYVDSLDPNWREDGYQNVYLWYQYESAMTAGRPNAVSLPAGHYQCRLLITEESFHNNYGATSSPYGGKWKTVLANEDFTTDAGGNAVPDTSASNDIVFDVPNSSGVYVAPPAAPVNLYFTTGAAQVNLSWAAVSGATYYNIKRSTTPGSGYVKIAGGVNTKTTSYTDNAVTPGVSYYYVVSAMTAGVEGANSSPAQPQPTPPTVPAAPSGLTAKAVTGAKMTLTWADNSSNESGFKIERYYRSWSQIATVGAGVTTYADSGLQAGKTYSYRVRAYNTTGNSAYSNTSTASAIR